jgi:hypothetical protein
VVGAIQALDDAAGAMRGLIDDHLELINIIYTTVRYHPTFISFVVEVKRNCERLKRPTQAGDA